MVDVAIFRKQRNNPTNRNLVWRGSGKSISSIIKEVKNAGVLTSGNYVAFKISENKNAFKIDGVSVSPSGVPFKH